MFFFIAMGMMLLVLRPFETIMVRWNMAAFQRELTIGGIPIVCMTMEGRVRMSSSTFGGFFLKDLGCGSSCAMDEIGRAHV